MYITVMWQVGPIGLQYPEGNGLGDQRLELDIARSGYAIEHEEKIAADPGASGDAVRQQDVIARRCIQFQKTVLLDQAASYCPDYVLRAHAASHLIIHTYARDFTYDETFEAIRQ